MGGRRARGVLGRWNRTEAAPAEHGPHARARAEASPQGTKLSGGRRPGVRARGST